LCTIFFASQGAAGQQTAPSKQSAHPVSKAPSPFADAKALLRQGKLEDAKNRIQEELQQNPSRPEGYGLLGLVYTAEKKYTEALSAFQRGLELNPKSTGIRIDMGNLYVAQGNFDLAEKEFREVVRLNPADNDGNYNLALVLLAKKQPAEAIPFLLRIHPPTIASQFSLTRAYLDAGKTAEGLKTAGELSVHNKDNVQVHFTLGVLLAGEKQLRPAQLQLEQANVLQPQTFEILYNLGQVYLGNAEYASAELSEARAESQARFARDPFPPGAGLFRAAEAGGRPGPAGARAQACAREYGHHLSPGACEYVSELLRGLHSLAGIRLENRSAAHGPARGTRGKLLHVGPGRESHRRVQTDDRIGSYGAILCIFRALLPSTGTFRRGPKIF